MLIKELKSQIEANGITVHRDMRNPVDMYCGGARLAYSRKWDGLPTTMVEYLKEQGFNNFALYTKTSDIIRFAAWRTFDDN